MPGVRITRSSDTARTESRTACVARAWPPAHGGISDGGLLSGSAYEPPDDEPCEALEIGVCHRCGKPGLDAETGEGPCKYCGWDYDDGLPEPPPSVPSPPWFR